jgi:hypothetical protein
MFIESSLRPIKKLAITREVWQYRKTHYDSLKKELMTIIMTSQNLQTAIK